MKNKIKKGIAILLIGSLLTLIYMIIVKSNHKQEVARSMQTIPTFCLYEYRNYKVKRIWDCM